MSAISREGRQALKRALERLFPAHDFRWRDRARYSAGLCPWHDDRHPSLSVFRAGSTWRFRCHACGKTGDLWSLRQGAGEPLPVEAAERLERRKKLVPALFQAALLLQDLLLEEGCPWLDQKVPSWRAVVEEAQRRETPIVGLYPAREELEERLKEAGLDLSELASYLWPFRQNGEPWELKGWIAWFQGFPGEICRIRVRKPGRVKPGEKPPRYVLDPLWEGGLVGLQLWPEKGWAETALLVEGETDWLAVQARNWRERGKLLTAVATGSASAVSGAVKEVVPWTWETGVLFHFPDYDLEQGQSPGLMAGLDFLRACREERVYGEVVFPPEYRPGQDPCDYLRDHALLLEEDAIPAREYVERVATELVSHLPEAQREGVKKVLLERYGDVAGDIPKEEKTTNILLAAQEKHEPERFYGPLAFPQGAVTLIAGTGSVGKTFLALQLIIELTSAGFNCAFLTLEDPVERLDKRLSFLARKYLKAHPEVEKKKLGKIHLVNCLSASPEKVLAKVEKKLHECEFVFVDPLAAVFEDENANAKVQQVMKQFNYLTDLYEKNVILLHHTRKFLVGNKKDTEPSREELYDAVRGASAVVYGARQVFVVRRSSMDPETLMVICVKSNYSRRVTNYEVSNLFNAEPVRIASLNGEESNEKDLFF